MKKTNGGIPPKVAAVHDLSCVGRCALTVVMPILSELGIQVCPLPTAVLSTHTGGYEGFTFLDLSDEMEKIISHWKSISERFDAVYSGFLGSAKQIKTVLDFVADVKSDNKKALFFADPVMGDDGKVYATYTEEMCRLTAKIVEQADIITPNLTEASILLGIEYKEDFSGEEIYSMLEKLSYNGTKSVVITGVVKKHDNRELIGAEYYDRDTKAYGKYFTERVNEAYPGTGEAFASVLLGELLVGQSLETAVRKSADFVQKTAMYTYNRGTSVRAGILLEPCLDLLKE